MTAAEYPESRRDDVADVLHGHQIADPYRWLEDPDAPATVDWVSRQNEVTEGQLAELPGRAWFQQTMSAIVRDLFRTTHPTLCPHGRPTVVRVPREELSRWFGRTGWRRQ